MDCCLKSLFKNLPLQKFMSENPCVWMVGAFKMWLLWLLRLLWLMGLLWLLDLLWLLSLAEGAAGRLSSAKHTGQQAQGPASTHAHKLRSMPASPQVHPRPSKSPVLFERRVDDMAFFITSGVTQWLACWAHNPKVRGSKPRSATLTAGSCKS